MNDHEIKFRCLELVHSAYTSSTWANYTWGDVMKTAEVLAAFCSGADLSQIEKKFKWKFD